MDRTRLPALDRFRPALLANGLGAAPIREFPEGTATAADAAAALGVEIGRIVKSLVFMAGDQAVVPPFGFPEPLRTYCDPDLLHHDEVWAAAGTPNCVFAISPNDLVRLTGAHVVDIAVR